MKRFAVIGNPVHHSLSPVLHNWVFKELGLPAHYEKIQCGNEDLPDIIHRIKIGELSGINVTIPHKEAILPYLDELEPDASNIKAVNCVVKMDDKLVGHNTDSVGFMATLRGNHIAVPGQKFILLGAGGVARSILYTLVKNGAGAVMVVNRTPSRSRELILEMESFSCCTIMQSVSLDKIPYYLDGEVCIINCTPVGMTPHTGESPIPSKFLRKQHILIDTIYTPLKTQFLRDGEQAGAVTINGLELFISQALASLDLWFGNPVSERVDRSRLKSKLVDSLR
ncbi:MAG: shikimate dehydrogenase [FCB group bacterium]|nr:shikimate dehydrogenase [FCB group bacterium]